MARRNKRDRWRTDVVKAKRLPSSTRLFLSTVLADRMRADGKVSRPRQELADAMGCDVRTVDRHFTRAVEVGWLLHVRAGFLGHTAEYEASWPDEMRAVMHDKNVVHMSDKSSRAYLHRNVAHMRDKNVAPSSSSSYYWENDTSANALHEFADVTGTHRRNVLALENEFLSNSNRDGRNHLAAVTA